MVINVILLQEVNGVKFGAVRNEVRSALGDATEFRKTQCSKTTTDDFGYCHVFYNEKDEFEAIEIFDYEDIIINGESVGSKSVESVMAMFDDAVEECGFISSKYSVGVYAPDNNIESFLFGCKGYYD